MNIHDNSRYHEVHARSLADPEGFWGEAAREIDWIEPAKKDLRSHRWAFMAAGSPAPWSTPATTRSTVMSPVAAPTRWR